MYQILAYGQFLTSLSKNLQHMIIHKAKISVIIGYPSAKKYNQVQPDLTKCNQMQPSGNKCNQVKTIATECNQVPLHCNRKATA